MNGLALKDLAHAMAVVAHEGQPRKGTGEPYVNHVERVADGVQGWEAKTVAYLHDLVEDTPVTFDTLRLFFPESVIEAVALLTRKEAAGDIPRETYKEFIERTATSDNAIALDVKMADVKDNLRDINDVPGGGPLMERRYTTALARLMAAKGIEDGGQE